MARVNVGIPPKVLTDSHLIAESVEITMITGSLKKNNFKVKEIPKNFKLGKGHMSFFADKILYLYYRLREVNNEMRNRGFKPGTHINLDEYPKELCNNWSPLAFDSNIVRERVIERIKTPLKAKKGFHKYYSKPLENVEQTCSNILNSQDFWV